MGLRRTTMRKKIVEIEISQEFLAECGEIERLADLVNAYIEKQMPEPDSVTEFTFKVMVNCTVAD
jgi:hypothetical protein